MLFITISDILHGQALFRGVKDLPEDKKKKRKKEKKEKKKKRKNTKKKKNTRKEDRQMEWTLEK